jgi:hypothetical protein
MAMANDEEDQTKNMFRSVGGGTSYIGGGYAGGGAQQQSPRETQGQGPGSGFVNIQEYLKGPERSVQAGQMIASDTDKMGQDTLNKLGDFEKEGSAIANVPEYDPNVGGSWIYNMSTSGTAPGQKAEFKENVPKFGGGDMINGFADVGSFKPAQESATKLGQRLGANQTESGLTEQFKGTPGEQRLTTALAMQEPGRNLIQGAQSKWGQVGGWLNKSASGVQNQIETGKQNAAKWQNAANLAQEKAGETNKIYGDLATKKQQQIAAMQPGPGAGNWTTPAQVPAAPAAPATTPRATAGSGMTPLEKRLMPDTDRMLTPTPGGAEYEPFRRSEAGRLSKEAQGGMYYYMQNNPINKGFTKTSDWLTKRIS